MTAPGPTPAPTVQGAPSEAPTVSSTWILTPAPGEQLPTTGPDAAVVAAAGLGVVLTGAVLMAAIGRVRRGTR